MNHTEADSVQKSQQKKKAAADLRPAAAFLPLVLSCVVVVGLSKLQKGVEVAQSQLRWCRFSQIRRQKDGTNYRG